MGLARHRSPEQPSTVHVVATYSKTRVDRSGRFLAESLRAAAAGERRIGQENAELVEAIQIVDWWRGEHARPLSRVATNLRSYAAEEGEPIVAQRLKKFPTIAGKLLREPRMKLSRMADIGGVRAVLSDQDAVYRVGRRLRRNWTITKTRDYIAEPEDDGYRALHLINRNRGSAVDRTTSASTSWHWPRWSRGSTKGGPSTKSYWIA